MKRTEQEIINNFNILKRYANKAIISQNYEEGFHIINKAACWMHRFNAIYTDVDLESVIFSSSRKLYPITKIVSQPENRSITFIDGFCYDNRCLTQQYLSAIARSGVKLQYISLSTNTIGADIECMLNSMGAEIVRIPNRKYSVVSDGSLIIRAIADFKPSKLLFHIWPWDVAPIIAGHAIYGIPKYNVNLTDHAFWLGKSLFDYNLEFRHFGELISLQKRGFKADQIIRMPYYPILPKSNKFLGFKDVPQDAVKIFCGGNEYKFIGDDDAFFKIMEILLDISPKIHILVAGINYNSIFFSKVKKMRNCERVHNVGFRKDINEAFRHSDIYLDSYPFSGGLMSQYAGVNSLPIISLTNPMTGNAINDVICQKFKATKACNSLEELEEYAKLLIEDEEFRRSEGKKCNSAMISEDEFNNNFEKFICNPKLSKFINWTSSQPDYKRILRSYIDNEQHGPFPGDWFLLGALKFKAFYAFPKRSFSFMSKGISYAWMKYKGLV